jgi:hypothetical protein
VMSIAYAKLGLGGFDQARAGMERYLATVKDYRGNQLPITEKERAIISVRWRRIFAAQGYQIRDQATPCPPG